MADDDAEAFRRQVYGDDGGRERDNDEPQSMRGRRLFVRGLPYDWDRERVRRELSKFGDVERLELPKARRGCGFVDYATERSASKAFVALDGRPLGHRRDVLCQMRVEPAFSPPLEDVEEEEELVCPIEFSGRGSKAERQREKRIDQLHRRSLFCSLCGSVDHFDQGCRLRDTSYHRAVAQGEVDPVEAFAPVVEAPVVEAPAPSSVVRPMGRGRGVSVPSWMADKKLAAEAAARPAPAPPPPPRAPSPRKRSRSRSRSPARRGERGGRRRAEPARDAAAEMRALDPYADQNVPQPRGFACALAGDGLHAVSDGVRLELRRAFPSGLVLAIDATPPGGLAPSDVDAAAASADRHAAANVVLRAAMAAAPFSLSPEVQEALQRAGAAVKTSAASVGEAVSLLAACGDGRTQDLPAGARCLWSPDHCAFYYVSAEGAMSWEPPAARAPSPPRRRGPSPPWRPPVRVGGRHQDRRRGQQRDRPYSSSSRDSRRGRYAY